MSGVSPQDYAFGEIQMSPFSRGTYILIDPSYVFGEDPFWVNYCGFCFGTGEGMRNPVYIYINGLSVFSFSTAIEQDVFSVKRCGYTIGTIPVDSGWIALVPENILEDLEVSYTDGVRVTFSEEFYPRLEDEYATFRDITIFHGMQEERSFSHMKEQSLEEEFFKRSEEVT